jgi:hypothetical protein
MVVQGAPLAGAQRRDVSQTLPPTEVSGKSHPSHSPDFGVPAPQAGGGVVSLGDSIVWTSCGEEDAPQGERVGKGH